MTRNVAIFGGAFDPIHKGHIDIVNYLNSDKEIDEILIMPSYNHPIKSYNLSQDSYDDFYYKRIEMIKLSIKTNDKIKISEYERAYCLKNGFNKTYTYDILSSLDKNDTNYIFVIGFDSIYDIETWHKYKELLNEYKFYVFDRDNDKLTTANERQRYIGSLDNKYNIKFNYKLITEPKIPQISSTDLKTLLKDKTNNKNQILDYLDEGVFNYILENNLYE